MSFNGQFSFFMYNTQPAPFLYVWLLLCHKSYLYTIQGLMYCIMMQYVNTV